MLLCQKGIQICSLLYLEDYRKINLTLYLEFYRFKLSKILRDKNSSHEGRLGGTAVKRLPSAQGVIPALWDRAPHQAPPL